MNSNMQVSSGSESGLEELVTYKNDDIEACGVRQRRD
jgi:hypothetical protein